MELLLKEAQQEIALLRTDLFNTRRLAEERRQGVDALQSERERLAKHCEEVEVQLRAANAQLNHVPELQQRCAHLEGQLRKLQSEIETAHAARRILEQELDDERRQRAAMTEQKALLEGDRARLAKQRDDLAAQLRVEQKKAREAEEEQVRAEEDAATLRAELAALQQSNAAAAVSSSSAAAALPNAAAAAAAGPASTADTAAAIAASVAAATAPLLEQVEHERNRAAMLLSNLHAAKSEIMDLSNKIADYEARHVQSISHGPQENEHLLQQLAAAQRRGDELAERLAEATGRSRQLDAEAEALREAAQAAAEAAAKAVDEAAAAKAAAERMQQQQQVGGGLHAGLPPLPPGGSQPPQHMDCGVAGGVPQNPATAALRQSSAEAMHHRVASSGSLYGSGHNELLMHEGGELSAEDAARLRQQVARLKASRDKLLLEIDKQWEEIERLSGENASLADDLRAARALATNWEKQAQDGIAQVEQLKDLLEDSARWEAATLAEHQHVAQHSHPQGRGQYTHANGGSPGAGTETVAVMTTAPAQQTLERLRVELLGEKARATELELQLRAVAAELLRCQHGSLDLGKSFLPMMAGVEKRLAELCRKARAAT
ncbi:hypothetical protein HYH02_006348 [Chlamydomonas schloesseri]|uniref:Uncharacterized protein n=1 Tax=Chlamydomonas schloesseri TaxID=2026947 RepID=A0A835WJY3_9CHLO|nr:hypothetical protein HYH02_006348 [Chlamydomonas schloesseri]|eukprot:KAG2448456.1 hypothetical protein HYH02_006348 [Chlamydomonas schloesseri]